MPEAFDANAPYLDERGFEYRDFGDYLCGKRADTRRNYNAHCYDQYGYRRDAVDAYLQAFGEPNFLRPSPGFARAHERGIQAAKATGGFGPPHTWK